LDDSAISGKIRPGMQIAVTMGSRGIRNSDIIVKSIVDYVKSSMETVYLGTCRIEALPAEDIR